MEIESIIFDIIDGLLEVYLFQKFKIGDNWYFCGPVSAFLKF